MDNTNIDLLIVEDELNEMERDVDNLFNSSVRVSKRVREYDHLCNLLEKNKDKDVLKLILDSPLLKDCNITTLDSQSVVSIEEFQVKCLYDIQRSMGSLESWKDTLKSVTKVAWSSLLFLIDKTSKLLTKKETQLRKNLRLVRTGTFDNPDKEYTGISLHTLTLLFKHITEGYRFIELASKTSSYKSFITKLSSWNNASSVYHKDAKEKASAQTLEWTDKDKVHALVTNFLIVSEKTRYLKSYVKNLQRLGSEFDLVIRNRSTSTGMDDGSVSEERLNYHRYLRLCSVTIKELLKLKRVMLIQCLFITSRYKSSSNQGSTSSTSYEY